MIPIFEYFPALQKRLPYIKLGQFPTAVKKLDRSGRLIGLDRLYMKDDAVSGQHYGGSKIRKLEFLLGKGPACGADEVMTFG
ncbi:MAG: hypothetical protein JW881_08125 [Spirochaetales bacterium]|nr:hypothetical protein [Spirochaetales bacterium]